MNIGSVLTGLLNRLSPVGKVQADKLWIHIGSRGCTKTPHPDPNRERKRESARARAEPLFYTLNMLRLHAEIGTMLLEY